MKLIGIKRKSDGEIVMTVPENQAYTLPNGLTKTDVQLVPIYIPEVGDGHKLLTGEKLKQIKEKQSEHLEKMAREQGIGVGDLVAAITTSTGFKKWWDEKHGGECTKCNEKQAVWNYYKFKGPSWISNWARNILKKI